MRNELSPFRFAICTVFFLGLFTLQAYAQEQDHAQDADHQKDYPNGIFQDWSRRHVVYPRFGPIESLIKLQHDPRAILSWQAAEREDWQISASRHRAFVRAASLCRGRPHRAKAAAQNFHCDDTASQKSGRSDETCGKPDRGRNNPACRASSPCST